MTIDTQTLSDVIIALLTTIGIALTLAVAMFAAGALAERGNTHPVRADIPAGHPDQPSDTREFVLR
jgi:hypothetical protein